MSVYMLLVDGQERVAFHAESDERADEFATNWGCYHKLRADEFAWQPTDYEAESLPSDEWSDMFLS